jgi:CRISPR/Cas system CSM-associated protein Csm4 (group 5 of RAMP superfamily)
VAKQPEKTYKKMSTKAASEYTQVAAKAKDTKEKVRQLISAIHEGGADDKELDKAVKDARAAVAHLRDFLKK